ncbi:hypothetical protein BBAD15_g4149 [Beauveria bassiana D1-5]|uniref:Uncharacterized protein n=1 Tax=Beauveria bassiana D1-5 TaxID=1245745 RepID=A0A0A2WBZ2_BEABA|nr:hypothetical protein BBAD15_g4149 [Beauveria bassiana D1-5]
MGRDSLRQRPGGPQLALDPRRRDTQRRRHPHAHRARRVLGRPRRLLPVPRRQQHHRRRLPRGRSSAAFERDCAAAWVKYFKQWRVADIQKRRRIEQLQAEGAVEANVTSSFAGGGNIAASSGGGGAKSQATREDIQALLDKKRG